MRATELHNLATAHCFITILYRAFIVMDSFLQKASETSSATLSQRNDTLFIVSTEKHAIETCRKRGIASGFGNSDFPFSNPKDEHASGIRRRYVCT
jgi:hypothetical protein